MASNTFFYALIIVGVLAAFFLFLRRGETCVSCSENFTQLPPNQKLNKEAEYRRKRRQELGHYSKYVPAIISEGESNRQLSFNFNYPTEPWPGYNKLSLYSQKVSPPNLDNYPYMNSPYNQVMTPCSMGCSDKTCVSDCVLHTLAETLPPIQ